MSLVSWYDAIPDMAGEILAARAWCLFDGRLLPIFTGRNTKWPYGLWQEEEPSTIAERPWGNAEVQEAKCWGTGKAHEPNEISPARGCACGFWGLTTPRALAANLSLKSIHDGQSPRLSDGTEGHWPRLASNRSRFVLGTVKLWGKVIPGQIGWRAQYGQIAGIIATSHPQARSIAKRYGVPTLAIWPELTPAWEKR